MRITSDTHVHSTFSFDGKDSIDDMVSSAITKGLKVIGFTEHIDANINDAGHKHYDYEGYSEAVERVRDRYSDQILILKGIEFSEPHLYLKEFERECKRNYDMIMVGLHWFDDLFYGNVELRQKYSREAIFERYFRDLHQLIRVGNFDVLAHFDLPSRYLGDIEIKPTLLQSILEILVENDIVPEVNSSRFRNGYSKSMPDKNVLEAYLKQGGRRITFGSDSHSVDAIGADFDKTVEHLGDTLVKLEPGVFVNREFIGLDDCLK